MKRLWKKGDVIVPRLNKSPTNITVITILNVKRGKYEVRDEKKKKELIDASYLDCGYINEDSKHITVWIKKLKGEEDEHAKTHTASNKRQCSKKARRNADSNVQKNSIDGTVRKQPSGTPTSSSPRKKRSSKS